MYYKITEDDRKLIKAAEEIINSKYKYRKHHIGAALRSKSGKIYTAVHLGAYVRRLDICAEAIVLGKAISEGEELFDTIVAVRQAAPAESSYKTRIVSPCGACRELIYDYGRDVKVIFQDGNEILKCNISDLLPVKYHR